MKHAREALIRDLAGDLKPVRRPGSTALSLLSWCVIAGLYSVAIVLVTGRLRDNSLAELLDAPAYTLEFLVAMGVIGLFARAALRTAIPDDRTWLRSMIAPLLALGAWLALIAWGLAVESAIPPSTLGKRAHCFLEAVFFGVPSFALLLWYARGLLPLRPRVTAGLAGAAAAALPAMLMQLACMYEPLHTLIYHLSPIGIFALLGVLIGPKVLARRGVVPRRRSAAIH